MERVEGKGIRGYRIIQDIMFVMFIKLIWYLLAMYVCFTKISLYWI